MSTEPELQPGTVDRPSPMTTATAANSTTLQQFEAKRARAKLVIGALTTLAGLLLTLPAVMPFVSPMVTTIFVVVAVALFLGAILVAYFTNTMTPEEIDDLMRQMAFAGQRLPQPAPTTPAPRVGPPES